MDASKSDIVDQEVAARLEERAGVYWNEFYKLNRDKFYKDRHWFLGEFGPQILASTTMKYLEVGCGTGSTIYPLLDITDPSCHVYGCDFAPEAVRLVREHPQFLSGRVTAFTADITEGHVFDGHVPASSVDVCMMVFVLSAISPLKMRCALQNVWSVLKDASGVVCFRDYSSGDLCEERMRGEGRQRKLSDGFYVRGDSTRCYYFSVEVLDGLFRQAGFVPVDGKGAAVVVKHELNRRTGEARVRRYVQAVYRKAERGVACADPFAGYIDRPGEGRHQVDAEEEKAEEAEEHHVGCLSVRVPGVRPIDKLLAAELCTSNASHTVELATARSSGVLSFAFLHAAGTRRHLCCSEHQRTRARMKRLVSINSSRFVWERLRIGSPGDAYRAQLIAFEWRDGDNSNDLLRVAAGLAERTGAKVVTACFQEDFEDFLRRASSCGLALVERRTMPTAAPVPHESTTAWRMDFVRNCDQARAFSH